MRSGKCLISQFNVDHSTRMPSYVSVLRDFAQLQLLNDLSRFWGFAFLSATCPTLPPIPQLCTGGAALLLFQQVTESGILILCLSQQCDAISVLEKEHDYRDEHFDFIQSHIRRFCLQCILKCIIKTKRTHFFSLIMTSLKEYLHLYQSSTHLLYCGWKSASVTPPADVAELNFSVFC